MKSYFRYFIAALFISIFTLLVLSHGGSGKEFKHSLLGIGYLTRPIWDSPQKPFQMKTHFHSYQLSDKENCELNGWKWKENGTRVFDAILFSVELDLLEIRMRELIDVVDKFVIIESNSTFTGLAKDLVFEKNKNRFDFARDKIVYKSIKVPPLLQGQDPFELEGLHRGGMNSLLQEAGIQIDDWVLMMDVDEIPSAHTVKLFKTCQEIPSPIHLQLRNYMYSFEFLLDMESWRGKAVRYPAIYGHSRGSDIMLADAGWHCSFCFRTLEDFQFKMKGYSHADRVHSDSILDLNRIQEVICQGTDIFDMLPEAYTFKELIHKWGKMEKQTSAIELPNPLLKDPIKFRFLLPGGCMRDVVDSSSQK